MIISDISLQYSFSQANIHRAHHSLYHGTIEQQIKERLDVVQSRHMEPSHANRLWQGPFIIGRPSLSNSRSSSKAVKRLFIFAGRDPTIGPSKRPIQAPSTSYLETKLPLDISSPCCLQSLSRIGPLGYRLHKFP